MHALIAVETGSPVLQEIKKLPGLASILHANVKRRIMPEGLVGILKQAVGVVSATHVVASASAVSKGMQFSSISFLFNLSYPLRFYLT